ncbi:hypothetical protein BIW11_09811 [Tropilaelaps mercedesae]|uniref:Uncharacterized protein n=1 Tax=Tropilaelaps mercedesae TaxID=418985 RepID=A0A1V9XIH3_9ACAR|nr:hypothetical protein BIW11_09811 [Tropilaelaps mercedesae]
MASITEEQLEQMALEEILAETAKLKKRAEVAGATGWRPQPKLNTTFVQNTLRSVRSDHKRRETRWDDEASYKCQRRDRSWSRDCRDGTESWASKKQQYREGRSYQIERGFGDSVERKLRRGSQGFAYRKHRQHYRQSPSKHRNDESVSKQKPRNRASNGDRTRSPRHRTTERHRQNPKRSPSECRNASGDETSPSCSQSGQNQEPGGDGAERDADETTAGKGKKHKHDRKRKKHRTKKSKSRKDSRHHHSRRRRDIDDSGWKPKERLRKKSESGDAKPVNSDGCDE